MKRGVAVADAGSLRYLAVLGQLEILPEIFTLIYVPEAVQAELLNASTPAPAQSWMKNLPTWMRIATPKNPRAFPRLHRGESSAIQLALEISADALLIDEFLGRRVGTEQGVVCMGTIGILEEAANLGLLDLAEAFRQLRTTNFFGSEKLFEAALARERRRRGESQGRNG